MLSLFEEIEAARDQSMDEYTTTIPSTPRAKGQLELNRLAWSLNEKGVQSIRDRDRGRGSSRFFMKPKILMWNVKRLNELNKRLRIRGLLRD